MKIVDLHVKPVKKEPMIQLQEMNLIKDFGPEGESYGGPGDRQITLLGADDMALLNKDREIGLCIKKMMPNITISGSSADLERGKTYILGDIPIKISDLKKQCYPECRLISEEKRICCLPKTVRFASVLKSGVIKINDSIIEN
jgi:MOSC domain-containing protein YiiM